MTDLDNGADLRAVMDRSMSDLDAPDHCGPAAVASGRRIRTRRRVTVGLTAVAAVAAVTALALPALGGSDEARAPYASDPTSAPSPAEPSDPATDVPAGWWDAPSTRLAEELERALPAGVTIETVDTTVEGVEPGQDLEAIGSLHGVLSSDLGPGAFQLLLWSPAVDRADLPAPVITTDAAANEHTTATASSVPLQSRIACRGHHDSCEPILDAEGVQIGKVSSNTERGTVLYEVTLLGPDDGGLNFTVMNSTGEKPGHGDPSADLPPLTLEQLRTLAEDPAWTSYRP